MKVYVKNMKKNKKKTEKLKQPTANICIKLNKKRQE